VSARAPDEVRTERLLLRRFRDHDLDPYAELCADPEVMEFLPPGVRGRQDCAQALGDFADHWRTHGFGLWCATRPPDDTCVGFIGLAVPTFLPEVLPAVEVGWRLARSTWGRGYATEGARAALDVGFDVLDLDRIVSITQPVNARSRNVMEKLGMTVARRTTHPEHGLDLVVYALDRPGR
jgi:RimJ/RimL family protein N-acetyltransferase